jgi:4-hydroxymandelate oxidase
MDLSDVKRIAREKFKGSCRVCPVCNGAACAGEVPGMGGLGTGAAFRNNLKALESCRLKLRTVHNVNQPRLASCILGMELSIPVMAAAIGGINFNMKSALTEQEYVDAVVGGCSRLGTIAMTSDSPNPEGFESGLNAIKSFGKGIPVIKPREIDKVIELARRAADAGAQAFGMDIDAAALVNMTNAGQPVGPKTQDELARIKQKTLIPFIVKGIMTREDAEACHAAGVDGIVVSNHGGRALDHVPGTAEVLPGIADAVRGKMAILVDGGIRSGVDVLKMLALGADAVLIGRPIAIGAVGGQSEGVELVLRKIADELRAAMVLTGTADVARVRRNVIC